MKSAFGSAASWAPIFSKTSSFSSVRFNLYSVFLDFIRRRTLPLLRRVMFKREGTQLFMNWLLLVYVSSRLLLQLQWCAFCSYARISTSINLLLLLLLRLPSQHVLFNSTNSIIRSLGLIKRFIYWMAVNSLFHFSYEDLKYSGFRDR